MQFVVLMMGIASSSIVKPIIGPPITSLLSVLWLTWAVSSKSLMGVPISASRFCGLPIAPPVIVTMREINGVPWWTAWLIAATVPIFWHTMPTSAGMRPLGTSTPVNNRTSCFSPPEGYLVGTTTISIFNFV